MNATQIEIIALLLRTIVNAIGNNSGDKAKVKQITDYVGLGATLIEQGTDTVNKLKELTAKVQEFVDQNRAPTDDEFADLQYRSDQAHKRIQAAARAGRPIETITPEPAKVEAPPVESVTRYEG